MYINRLMEAENYYEVRDGHRRWTVSMNVPDNPVILNEHLHVVKSNGQLGRRIIKAVKAYIERAL